jgi:DNA-binding MarR family transcriptional regulator
MVTSTTDLGWSLGVLFRDWQRSTGDAVGTLPHGPRGFQILESLEHVDGVRTGALAAHLGIDRTVLTYVIDDLVAAHLVVRTIDPTDRRAQRIALTDAGSSTLSGLRGRVAAGEQELLGGLDERQRDLLVSLLGRAAASRHAGSGEHDACRIVAEFLDAEADVAAGAA